MPLNDVDVIRRRLSVGFPIDLVEFILYSYNEHTFDEKHFQSVHELLYLLDNVIEDDKSYWIEVINRSSVDLPNNIKILCEYLQIHLLTMEDITTLVPYMKLDLFPDQAAIYLLMKIIRWNGQRVEQQQISFYLKCSQNLLITFQEKTYDNEPLFLDIRNQLQRQRQNNIESSPYNRLKQLNVDYLFYCLLDAIIDRYRLVLEEMSECIDRFDNELMTNKQSPSVSIFHLIYRLKHDLLHIRILFNPLKEIIYRLQRTTQDDKLILYPRTDPLSRFGMKHHIPRRQAKILRRSAYSVNSLSSSTMNITNNSNEQKQTTSLFFNEQIYMYFNDLNNHVDQLMDSVEIQYESVSSVISFWLTLSRNETQKILKFLMLLSVLFMPCVLLTGINSTNFHVQPHLKYEYGYYIVLALLALILIGMLTFYKVKRWI